MARISDDVLYEESNVIKYTAGHDDDISSLSKDKLIEIHLLLITSPVEQL